MAIWLDRPLAVWQEGCRTLPHPEGRLLDNGLDIDASLEALEAASQLGLVPFKPVLEYILIACCDRTPLRDLALVAAG
jgi:hypothetical protein